MPITDKTQTTHAPKGLLLFGYTTKDQLKSWYSKPRYAAKRHTCVSVRLVLTY